MGKVLIMVRTSTEQQSIQDQHNEMEAFVRGKGYTEKDIIWVEEQGASAAKMDDNYMAMISEVKRKITEDRSIDCFAVWHLNRALRTEKIYVDLKEFLVAHKVQMYCKNPDLYLLNSDGTVNKGMELAVGLMAILAQQDQAERKAKFARAKRARAEKGIWNGGWNTKYGYRVDENQMVVIDEESANHIRLIYELYSTGEYSYRTLEKELKERGIKPTQANIVIHGIRDTMMTFGADTLNRILSDTAYIGYTNNDKNHSHRNFIPIITQELFDKVAKIRATNALNIPHTNKINIASRILKCPDCGNYMYNGGRHYKCYRNLKKSKAVEKCTNDTAIRAEVIDNLVWMVAMNIEHINRAKDFEEVKKEAQDKLTVLQQKIATLSQKMTGYEAKKQKIIDTYLEDLISKQERDKRLASLKETISKDTDTLNQYREDEKHLEEIINKKSIARKHIVNDLAEKHLPEGIKTTTGYENSKKNSFKMLDPDKRMEGFELAHRHIKECIYQCQSYGHRDPRTKKPNALVIKITPHIWQEITFIYFPKKYEGHQIYYLIDGELGPVVK